MHINKLIIVALVTLIMVSFMIGIYYYKETKRLNKQINLLCGPPYNCGKWDKLTIGILLESLKKQHINIIQIKNIFTFYDIEFLGETNTNDIPWKAFDYENIDIHYDRSYDQIMILSGNIFLLFKDSILIDYRYNGDRDFLYEYLKSGGNITFD